jgi:hypothetical protein
MLRAALFHAHRHEAGCPKSGICSLHQAVGKPLPCGPESCNKFVGPRVEPEPTAPEGVRVRYLVHLESMVNVGCKFGPNDLDPDTWGELVALAIERARMDRLIHAAKDKAREGGAKETRETEEALRASREQLGIPGAGKSLFASAPKKR